MLAIYTSKRHAQDFDAPSEAWVAWSLIVWHRIRSLWCVARRSSISVRSRLRGRLAGGHCHIHDAILSSSVASSVSPFPSRSCSVTVGVVCCGLMLLMERFEGRRRLAKRTSVVAAGQQEKAGVVRSNSSRGCLEPGFLCHFCCW